jgi:hypothetical protein
MKATILLCFIFCVCNLTINAQAVYVDNTTGDDSNDGTQESPVFSIHKAAKIIRSTGNDIYTMKINPGLYVLDSIVSVSTDKDMTGKRIVIEAVILPGDPSWSPEKMPVIVTRSKKGEVPGEYYHYVVSFLIEESYVTIRGLKFPGYFYPNTRYFPIARFDKSKTDLFVEQCLFVGDDDASHLQVGIIAHGNKVWADHCIFYNARNSVVFWQDAGSGTKSGNGITNSIIYGASQSGVWTAWPDADFVFKHNIVTHCKYAWIKNADNPTVYTIDSCVIVNNQYYQGIAGNTVAPGDFTVTENEVIKEGAIALKQKPDDVDNSLPVDYLHVLEDSLGYEMSAGLFKKETASSINAASVSNGASLIQNDPNPFNLSTVIKYNLSEPGFTTLTICDLSGKLVDSLINEHQQAGEHEILWKADAAEKGMYLCHLKNAGSSGTLKILKK